MDKLEILAEALHDGWWQYKIDRGFQLGPRISGRKQHPHMVLWAELSEESKNQDRFQASLILFRRLDAPRPTTPEEIHENWRLWEKLHGNKHPHDKPFGEAHGDDSQEHSLQATLINELLVKWGLAGPK